MYSCNHVIIYIFDCSYVTVIMKSNNYALIRLGHGNLIKGAKAVAYSRDGLYFSLLKAMPSLMVT